MTFDYEQSVWGKGMVSLAWSSLPSFKLKQALKAIQRLSAGARVLEVGCGAGQFIRTIKQIRPKLECHGADISERALEEARTYGDGVVYAKNSEDTLPYADNFFDAIALFDVLEHVGNPDQLLREMRRVLKPGGMLYCFIPCEGDMLSLLRWLTRLRILEPLSEKYAGHINHWSRKKWLTLMESTGLRVQNRRYSEHILGQVLLVTTFILMDRAAKRRGVAQMNNEAYYDALNKQVRFPGAWRLFKRAVNSLIYLESTILQFVPSPNIHIIAKK